MFYLSKVQDNSPARLVFLLFSAIQSFPHLSIVDSSDFGLFP